MELGKLGLLKRQETKRLLISDNHEAAIERKNRGSLKRNERNDYQDLKKVRQFLKREFNRET